MARPKKTGLDYFPVDTSFDLSMEAYIAQTGAQGLGLWLILMQNIYREGGFFRINPATEMFITGKTRVSAELFRNNLELLFTLELLDRRTFEKHGILTGRGIQARYFEACAQMRREVVFPELYRVSAEETPVITEETPVFPAKSTQTKLKESKVKTTPNGDCQAHTNFETGFTVIESELNHDPAQPEPDTKKGKRRAAVSTTFQKPEVPEMVAFMTEFATAQVMQGRTTGTEVDPTTEAEAMFNHFEANGWRVGRTQMRDWRAAARNWFSRSVQFARDRAAKNRGKPGFGEGIAMFGERGRQLENELGMNKNNG